MPETTHHGRAVKRIREIMQIKQEALADELNISQQSASLLEAKEKIDPETLEQIAKFLKVDVEAIKNFNEEAAIYNIQHNYENAKTRDTHFGRDYFNCNFNPLDKFVETVAKNEDLYKALLDEKQKKIELLEQLLKKS